MAHRGLRIGAQRAPACLWLGVTRQDTKGGAVILAAGGWYWLDPAVALVIAVIIGYHAQKLVREAIAALRAA